MLTITVPAMEIFVEETNEFCRTSEQTLTLEHSLISLSKWESKWHKPFLSRGERTEEETLDYIRCMTITKNVNPIVYNALTLEQIRQIRAYIDDSMTATKFWDSGNGGKAGRETITSEIIYYWMVTLQIPFECEKWHLNRLLILIEVCNRKNSPAKKINKREISQMYSSINAQRRKKFGTRG